MRLKRILGVATLIGSSTSQMPFCGQTIKRGTVNKRLTRNRTAHRPRAGPGSPNRVRIHVGGRNRMRLPTNKGNHFIKTHGRGDNHFPHLRLTLVTSFWRTRKINEHRNNNKLTCPPPPRKKIRIQTRTKQKIPQEKKPTMTTGVCGPYCHSAGERSQFFFAFFMPISLPRVQRRRFNPVLHSRKNLASHLSPRWLLGLK